MFPRRDRLARSAFPTPKTSSRRASSASFTIVAPEQGEGYAVVVSKKVLRRAVDRHQFKRRIVAALRTLPLPSALVVYPRAAAVSHKGQRLQDALEELLVQIHKQR